MNNCINLISNKMIISKSLYWCHRKKLTWHMVHTHTHPLFFLSIDNSNNGSYCQKKKIIIPSLMMMMMTRCIKLAVILLKNFFPFYFIYPSLRICCCFFCPDTPELLEWTSEFVKFKRSLLLCQKKRKKILIN